MRMTAGVAAVILLSHAAALAGDDPPDRRPRRFAIVFTMGYAGDNLPIDPKNTVSLAVEEYATELVRIER